MLPSMNTTLTTTHPTCLTETDGTRALDAAVARARQQATELQKMYDRLMNTLEEVSAIAEATQTSTNAVREFDEATAAIALIDDRLRICTEQIEAAG
jgi:hypothetical protein